MTEKPMRQMTEDDMPKIQNSIDQGAYDLVLPQLIEAFIKRRADVAPIKRVSRNGRKSDHNPPEEPPKKRLRGKKVVPDAPTTPDKYVCREPMCGEVFTQKDTLYEHRKLKHNKEFVPRRKGPVLTRPDEAEWKEWLGRAKKSSGPTGTTFLCKYNNGVYEKEQFVGKCIRVPGDFGNGCSGARIIIDGVGEKMVKARFFDPQPASSRYYKPSNEGAPCFLAHSVLKEHL